MENEADLHEEEVYESDKYYEGQYAEQHAWWNADLRDEPLYYRTNKTGMCDAMVEMHATAVQKMQLLIAGREVPSELGQRINAFFYEVWGGHTIPSYKFIADTVAHYCEETCEVAHKDRWLQAILSALPGFYYEQHSEEPVRIMLV